MQQSKQNIVQKQNDITAKKTKTNQLQHSRFEVLAAYNSWLEMN